MSPERTIPLPPPEVEESTPALLGLRRFVVAARLAWTNETLDERIAQDTVITAAPEGARLIRGFRSEAEDPTVAPVTHVERAVSLHRQGQVRKIRKAGLERWRLNEIYGEKDPPPEEEPPLKREDFDSIDAMRWEESRRKIAKADRGKTNDLGSEAHLQRLVGPHGERQRMRHYQRQSELKAAKLSAKLDRTIDSRNARLDRGSAGETIPAATRASLIDRAASRQARLQERLEELRRLSAIRDEKRRHKSK